MKKKTTKNFTNYKMNSEVYKQRQQVMSVIYAVKNNCKPSPILSHTEL